MIFKKYTCLLMGVFLFGGVCGQEAEVVGREYCGSPRVGKVMRDVKPTQAENIVIKHPEQELWDEMLREIYFAQNRRLRKTLNTFMIGAGSSNMYDTYLSPLEYSGYSLRLMYEQMRDTYWLGGKFRKQQLVEAEFASGQNPIKNSREYWGKIRYQLGGHYGFYETQGLKLNAGGYWDVNAGGLYNERNGNNPATGRVYTNLNLSVLVSYKWKKYAIRWQIDTPFMGMLFSPKYGQSYYEISLGNTVGIVNFASFHNQRALRNFVTLDIPFNSYVVRIGYLGDWYQTKVHGIQTHHYTHSFVVGFPLEGVKQARSKTNNSYWD